MKISTKVIVGENSNYSLIGECKMINSRLIGYDNDGEIHQITVDLTKGAVIKYRSDANVSYISAKATAIVVNNENLSTMTVDHYSDAMHDNKCTEFVYDLVNNRLLQEDIPSLEELLEILGRWNVKYDDNIIWEE